MLIGERAVDEPVHVLVVEDNPFDVELELRELHRAAIPLEHRVAASEAELRAVLPAFEPDVVLCDLSLGGFTGIAALRLIEGRYPCVPVIFVTGTVTEEQAVIAMQSGAVDYLLKSNLARLAAAVLRALDEAAARKQRILLETHLDETREQFATISLALDSVLASYSIPERRFLFVSPAATRVYGYAPEAFLAQPEIWKNVILLEDRPVVREAVKRLFVFDHYDIDYRVAHPNGETHWLNHRARLARDGGGRPVRIDSVVADVTVRMEQERRVRRLSRIRDVLSAVNAAIIRAREPVELVREACRIAFGAGGYINVFALTADVQTQQVSVQAAAGAWEERAGELESSVQNNVSQGKGVIWQALCTARPGIINELDARREADLHESLLESGVRAIGVFPLIIEEKVTGAVVLDTPEIGYFDADEVELLETLTGNISFALEHMRRQERIVRLSRIRDVLSAVNAAIIRLHDRAELFQEACRIAVEAGGFRNVFVAEIDLSERRLEISAFLGTADRDEMERIVVATLGEASREPGIIETSMTTLRPAVRNDLLHGPSRLVHEDLVRLGIRASGSFPLVVDGCSIGAMVFETDIAGYFDEEEIGLLTNLVSNLSFALTLIEKQQRVTYLSFYDALTQLPNRSLFYDRLGQDIAAAAKAEKLLALALLDISRFSVLNSTLGEHVGDAVLRKIADRLRASAQESRIARVGGDKFVLCFPMIDDLHPVTDVITEDGITIFQEPFRIEDRELHIMARAGCAVFPNDGDDPVELFGNAEAALLSAKASGTTYRFYAPELNARLAKQLDLEARLQRAIEQHQFCLFYQPKVELGIRKVVGFEALIRWRDPERGLISPGEFIPLLEQTGIIITVGRWAMGEAVRQYEEWRAAGLKPPRIAVNLSAIQLRQERLLDDVRGAVGSFAEESGLDLEVTESMLMENFDEAIAKLNGIRDLGVHISLDDFGTGYSSLSYLHRLPLHALKIDRSFIVGMTEDPNKTSIVSTIISLAQALRLKVIAEGVETLEQERLLQLLRCDQIQGYLIARPEPAEIAAKLLTPGTAT